MSSCFTLGWYGIEISLQIIEGLNRQLYLDPVSDMADEA